MHPSSVALLVVVILLTAAPAFAYVDPATGGVLVQLVTGGVAGAAILLRLYWRRVKDALTRHKAGEADAQATPESPTDAGKVP